MSLPRGRTVPLSRGRRFVLDVMHFAQGVPLVTVERDVDVSAVAAARSAAEPKPGWVPIFVKAFARAAVVVPDLRRSLLTVPWTRLHEHACSVACLTVEREVDGEQQVFVIQIRQPEDAPLADIAEQIRKAKTAPVREVAAFRRNLLLLGFPRPLRRLGWWLALRVFPRWRMKYIGTFVVSSVASLGAGTTAALTPLTTYFTFDPVRPDGTVRLRLMFDHRVTDAGPAARALAEMERALNSAILTELRGMVSRTPPPTPPRSGEGRKPF